MKEELKKMIFPHLKAQHQCQQNKCNHKECACKEKTGTEDLIVLDDEQEDD